MGVNKAGEIFIADQFNNAIRKITPDGVVTTFAGVAIRGSRDGIGTYARFDYPAGVAHDAAGTLYIADSQNETIRKITPDGVVTTLAGKVQTAGYVDGNGADARFSDPEGVAVDSAGNLYVADIGNSVVRKITPAADVSTIANGYDFNSPSGVAVDARGNIYVTSTSNQTIDKVKPDGTVTILAGSPGHRGFQDGVGRQALFYCPTGIAVDSAGKLYVADSYNEAIRKITPGGLVTTLAGGRRGGDDGTGSQASFREPRDVSIDGAGNLYVTDLNNLTIRKVTSSGFVTTLAGLAEEYGWIDGTGQDVRMLWPVGISADSSGTIYFADSGNQTIRKGAPAQ